MKNCHEFACNLVACKMPCVPKLGGVYRSLARKNENENKIAEWIRKCRGPRKSLIRPWVRWYTLLGAFWALYWYNEALIVRSHAIWMICGKCWILICWCGNLECIITSHNDMILRWINASRRIIGKVAEKILSAIYN